MAGKAANRAAICAEFGMAEPAGPLAIVVVNNDGGRIFERLPLGRDERMAAARERLFVTPHGRSFDGLAATWGLGHARVETPAGLVAALRRFAAEDPAARTARKKGRPRRGRPINPALRVGGWWFSGESQNHQAHQCGK